MPPTFLLFVGAMVLAPIGAVALLALIAGALMPRFRTISLRALTWGLGGGLLPALAFGLLSFLLLEPSERQVPGSELIYITIFLAGFAAAVVVFYGWWRLNRAR